VTRTGQRPWRPVGAIPWRPVGATLAALALAVLALVVDVAPGTAAPSVSIVLYTGQHPQLTDQIVAAFTRQTGIAVRVRTNDGIVLADQILQEGGGSPADVYLTENSPELMFLEQHGLFAKVSPATLSEIPARDNSPSGHWVGVALRVSSLSYDTHLVSRGALPTSLLGLADPRWKGKVAVAPVDSDFPPLVSAVLARYGTAPTERWLAGLKRNALIYQDEEGVVAAVNRGAAAVGIANQYYWYRLRLEVGPHAMHSALYYFPHHDVGSIENVSGAAVLASSHHRAAAESFLSFLVSPTAQHIIATSDDYEYPARAGTAPNGLLPPLRAISPDLIPAASLGNDHTAAQLIEQAGLA
jgi:iron(III) transport system substrate-binding protein